MSTSKKFYFEMPDGEEYEFLVEADEVAAYNPGRTSGPMDRCYPPEGGYATVDEGSIRRRVSRSKDAYEPVSMSTLLEAVVYSKGLKDEQIGKRTKSAMQQAEELICDALYEAACEDAQAAYEDAMESRAEWARDR